MKLTYKRCVSDLVRFAGKNKLGLAIGGLTALAAGYLINRFSYSRKTETVSIDTEDVALVYEELDRFIAGMASVAQKQCRMNLKRELTSEEIYEIERRIYFNEESMQDILAEMDLLK